VSGSFPHLVDDDNGKFRFNLIENVGEAREALADCFVIIYKLSGGNLHRVREAIAKFDGLSMHDVNMYHPGDVNVCQFTGLDWLDDEPEPAVVDVHIVPSETADGDADEWQTIVERARKEVEVKGNLIELLAPLGRIGALKAIAMTAVHFGHYQVAANTIRNLEMLDLESKEP
jgi:hypothetical protein